MTTPLEKAHVLVSAEILPSDIEEQLQRLESQAAESERRSFGYIWEALAMRQNEEPEERSEGLTFSEFRL